MTDDIEEQADRTAGLLYYQHSARALLLGIGECPIKDADGWMHISPQSPGFRTLPKELYEIDFDTDAPHSAGARTRLTPLGQRTYEICQRRIGKSR